VQLLDELPERERPQEPHGVEDCAAHVARRHGNNGGLGYSSTLAGTHGIGGAVNFVAAITYSNAGTTATAADDTCSTTICHSDASRAQTAVWGTPTSVACNHCHYWAADPASAAARA